MTARLFGRIAQQMALLATTSLLLTVGVVLAGGAALLQTPTDNPSPAEAKAPTTPADAQPQQPPRRDLYGNLLPDGALARMGTERLRHPYARSIAFTADGKTLISAGQDQTVRFWDCATGQLKRMQRLPRTQPVAALSPDGKSLALIDAETESVILWDVTANQETRRITADQLDFDTLRSIRATHLKG
jgi:WD40 repeat protein